MERGSNLTSDMIVLIVKDKRKSSLEVFDRPFIALPGSGALGTVQSWKWKCLDQVRWMRKLI